MKKFTYLAAFAIGAMTLASCSNDEVLSSVEKSGTIGFNAMTNKPGRTGEVNTNNLERFRVFGWSTDNNASTNFATLFNDVTVTGSGQNWTYSPLQYWAPSKDYYFVALSSNNSTPVWEYVAPASLPESTTVNNFKGLGTVTTGIGDVNADRDLVYAVATRATDADITDATKVPFTFNHMLSRIGVTFKNAFKSSLYSIVISNVAISGLSAEASVELGVDPKELAWQVVEGAEPIGITATVPNNNNLAQNESTKTDYKFIIPSEQTIAIQFDVEVKVGESIYSKRTLNGTIAAKTYKPGMSYMFTAEISQDNIVDGGAKPIEFTVTSVTGWGTDEEGSVTFPTTTNP